MVEKAETDVGYYTINEEKNWQQFNLGETAEIYGSEILFLRTTQSNSSFK